MINSKNAGRKLSLDPADAFLHIRCKKSDKVQWVNVAQGRGGLSAWVVDTLNKEAKKQLTKVLKNEYTPD